LPPNWFRKTHEKLVYLVENSIYLHDIFILNLVHHCFWAHAKIGNGRQRIQWEVSTQHVQTPQVPPALERLIPYPHHCSLPPNEVQCSTGVKDLGAKDSSKYDASIIQSS
jgi:hypothetical protein